MNKFQKIFFGMILSSVILIFSPNIIKAENIQDPNILYQKGIEFGAIDPSETSKTSWEEQEKAYRENYDNAIN